MTFVNFSVARYISIVKFSKKLHFLLPLYFQSIHVSNQVIEPLFNEVSQTLSNALGGKFDYIDRQSQRRKDISNDLEYVDNDDTDDNSYVDDDDDDNERYYPTLPPIYPSVKRKPENRSMKSSR